MIYLAIGLSSHLAFRGFLNGDASTAGSGAVLLIMSMATYVIERIA